MEFVEQFGLDEADAYSDKINEAMLKRTYDENIASGVDEQTAMKNYKDSRKDINELLAKNGML